MSRHVIISRSNTGSCVLYLYYVKVASLPVLNVSCDSRLSFAKPNECRLLFSTRMLHLEKSQTDQVVGHLGVTS